MCIEVALLLVSTFMLQSRDLSSHFEVEFSLGLGVKKWADNDTYSELSKHVVVSNLDRSGYETIYTYSSGFADPTYS